MFLDASTHLYMRVCPSVRPSIRPSVRWLRIFFLIAEIDKKQHRIIGKVETLFLDCNSDSIISMQFPIKFRGLKKNP